MNAARATTAISAVILSVLASCSPGASTSTLLPTSIDLTPHGQRIAGGTVVWSGGAGQDPNYIFPMAHLPYFSPLNQSGLSYLLYRPLYWFGNNNQPTINEDYSLAQLPTFSDNNTTVTVRLKDWMWSNGEKVTSRNIEFWMNLLTAMKGEGWGGYIPGQFPDNVVAATYPDERTVVFKLDRSYNPTWFVYTQLSQITPIPMAWDRTSLDQPAPHPDTANLPDTTPAGARAVYQFLDRHATDRPNWASSPLWSIVNGPFRVESTNTNGDVTFVPNPAYSGSPKPSIDRLVEKAFASNQTQLNVALSGTHNLDIGFLPLENLPARSRMTELGYRILAQHNYNFGLLPLNMNNPEYGPLFRQLYFRQAMQSLINQHGWIEALMGGNGIPTYGPIPPKPANDFAGQTSVTNRYPYSIETAKKLLADHGWAVKPGGITTCARPGNGPTECGEGVPADKKIDFNIDYVSGTPLLAREMADLQSSASQVGIKINPISRPLSTLFSDNAPCAPEQNVCKWTALDTGAGWVYTSFPSGEQILATGAAGNAGNYSDPRMDALIERVIHAPDANLKQALNDYQDFVATNLPVLFVPVPVGALHGGGALLVSNRLGGYTLNAFPNITPETWYRTR